MKEKFSNKICPKYHWAKNDVDIAKKGLENYLILLIHKNKLLMLLNTMKEIHSKFCKDL